MAFAVNRFWAHTLDIRSQLSSFFLSLRYMAIRNAGRMPA